MDSMLDILSPPQFSDKIVGYNYQRHTPYNMSDLGNNAEIRIIINQNEIYAPFDSYLSLEGKLRRGTNGTDVKLVNNAFAHLFETISYRLNGTLVDQIRNPGITSTLKGLISFTSNELNAATNAGFIDPNNGSNSSLLKNDRFNVCIPLKYLLGFFEDSQRVVINMSQELVLVRSGNDLNALVSVSGVKDASIVLDKIAWVIPHVKLADRAKAHIYTVIGKDPDLSLTFRSWEYHEMPNVPHGGKEFTWSIKTSAQLHKPRFVLVAFYTDKKHNIKQDISQPDNLNIQSYRLYLNHEVFPFQELNLDVSNGIFSELYESYLRIHSSYYSKDNSAPILARESFGKQPFICIDCSKQVENLKDVAQDCRLEVDFTDSIPEKTNCVTIIIYDKLVTYAPLSSVVKIY